MRKAGQATGWVERAVTEAVGAVAAPSVCAEVVETALRWARRSRIPEVGPDVTAFVEGPLFFAVERALGEAAASMVRDELAPVAARLREEEVSEVRPSWPVLALESDPEVVIEAGPAVTAPAPRGEIPRILVASASPVALAMLTLALGGSACVEPVRDALAMLEEGAHELMVLDCRNPTVRLETLLALQPELPASLRVVLWGEPATLERELAAIGPGLPESWVCCGANASADDVAAVCRVFVG